MPITRKEVRNCYRYILGRDPESEQIVEEHMISFRSFDELRKNFLKSIEFSRIYDGLGGQGNPVRIFDFSSPAMEIEPCSAQEIENIFRRTQREWKAFGQENPFWSVLTHDEYKQENMNEETKKKFYESGRTEADSIVATLKRNDFQGVQEVHGGGDRNLFPVHGH